jgi:hypothetical protein
MKTTFSGRDRCSMAIAATDPLRHLLFAISALQ